MAEARDGAIDRVVDGLSARQLAGQLLVVGYAGLEPAGELQGSIEAGERAGIILFRRNISPGIAGLEALQGSMASLARRSPPALPLLVAIDEEGHPIPVPPLAVESELEQRRQREAELRRQNRLAEREQIRAARDD